MTTVFNPGDRVIYEKSYGKSGLTEYNGCHGTIMSVITSGYTQYRVKWDGREIQPFHYEWNLHPEFESVNIIGDNDDDCI